MARWTDDGDDSPTMNDGPTIRKEIDTRSHRERLFHRPLSHTSTMLVGWDLTHLVG
ncbi:MAG: hypothetical protein GY820_37140 [Gammaproteobacteria bacterium]|nr:hypothetical protein [Gammaproteobacteria bacterium]